METEVCSNGSIFWRFSRMQRLWGPLRPQSVDNQETSIIQPTSKTEIVEILEILEIPSERFLFRDVLDSCQELIKYHNVMRVSRLFLWRHWMLEFLGTLLGCCPATIWSVGHCGWLVQGTPRLPSQNSTSSPVTIVLAPLLLVLLGRSSSSKRKNQTKRSEVPELLGKEFGTGFTNIPCVRDSGTTTKYNKLRKEKGT